VEDLAPSAAARALVRGAFDLHVHIWPDVVERRIDDVSLARRFHELGLAGFVLKSHYTSTAERAAVVSAVCPGVTVLGAIALNRAVGGLNALAVEIAAREGARVVWLPTVDAVSEAEALHEPGPGVTPPIWVKLQREFRARGLGEPVPVLDAAGRVLSAARAVLASVAAHGLVLATGHLGREETFAVVEAALEEGVAEIVVTHPDYPAQALSGEDQRELAGQGALIERCFTTPHTGKVSWERWLGSTRLVGAERCVLSTDLGQVANPPVEDGLALLADRLLEAGFTEEEVRTMAVTNTRRLAGMSP
jgi:Family of unknown function (DUF6282)